MNVFLLNLLLIIIIYLLIILDFDYFIFKTNYTRTYETFTILNDDDLLKCFSSKDINTMDYSQSNKVSIGNACCYLTPVEHVYGLPTVTMNGYYLNNMCVDPKKRKQGLGNKLVNKVINEAKKENKDHIILYVDKNNTPAINLYKKNNFRMYQNLDKIIIMVKNL
jgi:ribosomal protein S18 acetylase RimI-like enzyme